LKSDLLPYSDFPGFSRLFLDFVNAPDKLRPFFGKNDIADCLQKVSIPDERRRAIRNILSDQNRNWKAPEAVFEAIDKLNHPQAVAVVAGQQAGLFGGPYLALLKAMAAVKAARDIEEKFKVPAAPIFWIASDDHDLKEISSVDIFDMAGQPVPLSIDVDKDKVYPPVGELEYDDSISEALDHLKSHLPENDFYNDAFGSLSEIYRPGRKIVDCFAEYILSLTGHLGIVPFNPHDRRVKELSAPIMKEMVSKKHDIITGKEEADNGLTEAGYHLQVKKDESATHLFYHSPQRMAIHSDGDRFTAGDSVFSEKELLEKLESNPSDFSPDVITRPLVQSFLFPVAAIIGGPAEIAYIAQIMPLFDLLGMGRPRIMVRPSITPVEKRYEKIWDKFDIGIEDLAGDIESTINAILRRSYPDDFDKDLESLSEEIRLGLDSFRRKVSDIDPGLADAVDRTAGRIDHNLNSLGKKVFAAHKKRHDIERQRIYRLRDHILPGGNPPERSIAPVYYISRYGRGVIDIIFDNLNLNETGHRFLMLSRYYG